MNPRTSAVESAVLRLFGRRGEVRNVETVGEQFRLVTIGGDDLVDREWAVGDMIQVSLGSWQNRAYTPLSYDSANGSLEFVAHVHGNGIGSAWLESLRVGDPCLFVGPRAAVKLDALPRPALLFGDETSFSTAAALRATAHGDRHVSFVFEVTSPESCLPIIDRLGLSEAKLFRRESEDRHLDAVEAHVLTAFGATTRGVLTGKASSIARVYKALRRVGISGKQVTNVAYWAPGKKGFSGVQR